VKTNDASHAGQPELWALSGSTATAVDTTGGNTASLSSGATWPSDPSFSTTIGLDGTGYLTPPAATVPVTDPDPTISVWFKTTTAGGVIASLQGTALTPSGTATTQTLTVDGYNQGSLTAALKLQGDANGNTNLTFGAGYIGGNWPAEPHQGQASVPYYLQGQIADITFAQ
jgi:hypothetical protein